MYEKNLQVYNINGVFVTTSEEVTRDEATKYVEHLEKEHGRALKNLQVQLDGDYADLTYEFKTMPFERIRRITGYLVGTMERWNDAKTAEEKDRVKHDVEMERL